MINQVWPAWPEAALGILCVYVCVCVCVFVVLFTPMMTESCDQLLRPCAGTFTLSEAFVDVTKVVLFWTLPSCDGLVGIAQTLCRLSFTRVCINAFRNNLQAGGARGGRGGTAGACSN